MCARAKVVINKLNGGNKILKNEIKKMQKLKGENKMLKIKCIIVFCAIICLFVVLKHM